MTSAGMVVCASHTPGMLRDKKAEFGHAFRAGVAEAAARVAAFAPELVVFFGSDHRRAFVDPVPAIAGDDRRRGHTRPRRVRVVVSDIDASAGKGVVAEIQAAGGVA